LSWENLYCVHWISISDNLSKKFTSMSYSVHIRIVYEHVACIIYIFLTVFWFKINFFRLLVWNIFVFTTFFPHFCTFLYIFAHFCTFLHIFAHFLHLRYLGTHWRQIRLKLIDQQIKGAGFNTIQYKFYLLSVFANM
jgi:hypothetical protein